MNVKKRKAFAAFFLFHAVMHAALVHENVTCQGLSIALENGFSFVLTLDFDLAQVIHKYVLLKAPIALNLFLHYHSHVATTFYNHRSYASDKDVFSIKVCSGE